MNPDLEALFYEIEPRDFKLGSWCKSPMAYFRGEEDIPDAVLRAGFQVIEAPVTMEEEPVCHREEETIFILGATLPDVFSSFDAEVQFYMGPSLDKMEKIVVTEPTTIRVPKYWWHGPLKFVRVDKPVLFQASLQAGRPGVIKAVEHSGKQLLMFLEEDAHLDEGGAGKSVKSVSWTAINEDGVERYTEKGAYDQAKAPKGTECVIQPGYKSKPYSDATTLLHPKPSLSVEVTEKVLAMPREETKWGDWCPSPQTYFRGDIYMENATYNVGWQVFTGPIDMEEPHFHMGIDEYIFFVGANPLDIFDFDAKIDFAIGFDRDHMESRTITKPTVVRLPPTVWHCPIKFREMKKPLVFQSAFPDGTWGTITRGNEPPVDKGYFSRTYMYDYMGDNVRFCRFNEKKRCNICGECFPKQEIEE
ncbi:MAG: hypothetical protein ACOYIK_06890 [Coriobacteriales bacterium]|jgi:hypothetical protein